MIGMAIASTCRWVIFAWTVAMEPRPEPRACDSGCQPCQGAPPWAVMDEIFLDSMLPAAFAAWFHAKGWTPRRHQLAIIAAIRQGRDTLLIAPTGGGKTLAGF